MKPAGCAGHIRLSVVMLKGVIVGVGMVLLAGWLAGDTVVQAVQSARGLSWPELMVTWAVAFVAAAVLHELGHALGGWLTGGRLTAVGIGPFMLARRGGRLRLRRTPTLALWNGFCLTEPPRGPSSLRRQHLVKTAAGPLASLALAAFALVGAPNVATSDVAFAFWALFASSTAQLVAVLAPSHGGPYTDGAKVRVVLRGGAPAQHLIVADALINLDFAGVLPRHWPAPLLAELEAALRPDAVGDLKTSVALLIPALIDHRELARADIQARQAWCRADDLPASFRLALDAQIPLIAALQGDVARARAAWTPERRARLPEEMAGAVDAAIARAEGSALPYGHRLPEPGHRRGVVEMWHRLRSELVSAPPCRDA